MLTYRAMRSRHGHSERKVLDSAVPSTCSSARKRFRHMRAMILADNEKDRRTALKKLLPMQRDDFAGVFKAMDGLPVTIRTLDPPLHEFLPRREDLMVDIATLSTVDAKSKKELVAKIQRLRRQSCR